MKFETGLPRRSKRIRSDHSVSLGIRDTKRRLGLEQRDVEGGGVEDHHQCSDGDDGQCSPTDADRQPSEAPGQASSEPFPDRENKVVHQSGLTIWASEFAGGIAKVGDVPLLGGQV
ncbi:hypothetical protein [Deinococcus gobiensis]|uniref:hypothetical protein n=1 Tax=Deinococcus gobiensis TaxID=502394 RepID=UPI0014612FD9|nr:hypothetical protein [Deinococcus gobiensis]